MTETIATATAEVVEKLTREAVDPRKMQRTKNHPLRKYASDVERDAFGQVVQQVAADAERDVWHGTP